MKKVFLFIIFSFFIVESSFADQTLWVNAKDGEPQVELNLPSFAPVIEKLGKTVVNIAIEGEETVSNQFPGMENSPFEFFFGQPNMGQSQKRSFQSLGSGFVIHPDGYIVTNHHVVAKAKKIKVYFKDEKSSMLAKVVGSDEKTDIALLKVDSDEKLESVVFADSDKIRPGDWVIAIGNPFRLGHTATAGIVSAVSRKVPGSGPYADYIQTDASINPGNSGGPLFNANGEVIGINTAIFTGSSNSVGNIGIGFALPINLAKEIISQLHEKGKVIRGWLGVYIQSVSDDVAQAMRLDDAKGALVADVLEGSPALKAGVMRGDVIVKYNGKLVNENDDLPMMVASTPVGSKVGLEIIRAGKSKKLDVKIEELKEEQEQEVLTQLTPDSLGLTVQEVTPDIAASIGLNQVEGVVVTSVAPDSVAAKSGLKRADVILEIASTVINTYDDFVKATKRIEKNKPVLFLLRRGANTIFLPLKIEE